MRNNFLEKTYSKCGKETSRRLFSEKSNISPEQSLIQFVFIVCQAEGYRSILKLSCRPLAFKKQKEVWNWSPCLIFSIIFQEKYVS